MTERFDENRLLTQRGCRRRRKDSGGVVPTIRDVVRRAAKHLHEAGVEEARREAWLLLAHVLRRDRATLLAHARDALDPKDRQAFERVVSRRGDREPFAQIVGGKEFWSLDFRITTDVLCPRPDSECLIEAALAEFDRRYPSRGETVRLLDLGAGSGCLLLALLSELPGAKGIGIDVSVDALSVACENGVRLGLADRAHWLGSHWGAALDGRFDLIVANPPYIAEFERPSLAHEVRRFEPAQALFAGADGLDAYRALASDLRRLLATGGFVCLEIGEGQAVAVERLLERNGLRTLDRRRDLAGIDRCIIAECC